VAHQEGHSTEAPLSRRRVLGILAAGTAAPLLAHFLPLRVAGESTPPAPATNIAEALKHPRTLSSLPGLFPGKVVRMTSDRAFVNDAPEVTVLDDMLARALNTLTGASSPAAAWRLFVTPDDVIGIKVNPVAGKLLSTSPEIVHTIIRQLESAGVPRSRIVIWDRREFELQETGFTAKNFPGVRITGTEQKDKQGSFTDADGKLYGERMIDREWYYWADVEEPYDAETLPYMINTGRYSYFSRICTKEVTKIINVPILKNAGSSVTLCLKNLAFGSISNTGRLHKGLWHRTIAEVPAFAPLRDKVVLNIVDGIRGCYQGGPGADPRFITTFNTLIVGTDPVAVDRIGYDIVLRKRIEEGIQGEENPKGRLFLELAEAQGLGTSALKNIDLETI
jgi:uncharacterized protein (DUF362 family)